MMNALLCLVPAALVASLIYAESGASGTWSLAHFTSYLAAVVRRNLPLGHALSVYADDLPARRRGKRRILLEIAEAVDNGAPLADAMGRYPGVFPGYYRALVRAGEKGGNLARVLGRLGEAAELDSATARRVAGHASYPVILAFLALGALGIAVHVTGQLLPPMVTADGVTSPRELQATLAWWSHFAAVTVLVVFGALAVLALAGPGVFGRLGRWFPELRWISSRVTWYCPLVAYHERRRATAGYALAAGQLLEAGVPTHEALVIAATASGNGRFDEIAAAAAARSAEGEKLSAALRSADTRGELPRELVWHVELGERSGRLPEALARASESAAARSRSALTHMSSLVLPAGVAMAGLAIGLMAYSVFGSISALHAIMVR